MVTTPCETTTKVELVLVSNRQYLVLQRQPTSTLRRVVSQETNLGVHLFLFILLSVLLNLQHCML
jgi:hypothetical protein